MMALEANRGAIGQVGGSLGLGSLDLVKAGSIGAILDAGGTRADLLLAATRELTALLGDRGTWISMDGSPRISVAPADPTTEGRSVDLAQHPEIAEALLVRDLVVGANGASSAVPLFVGERCLNVVLVQSDRPRRATPLELATVGVVARLTAALLPGAAEFEGAILAPMAPSPSMSVAVVAPPAASTSRRLLIVEDDALFASSLTDALASEGYLVEHAGDGRVGVECALSNRPDLILLDVNLPSLDGFMAAAQLRESPITRDVPIIFLSARRDLSARVRVLHFENVDFIPKPFREDDLLARIEQALVGAQARQRLQHRAAMDDLTGLGNLSMFRARLAEEHKRVSRYGTPLSLAMIDVDKLKAINDQLGHVAGSDVLRAIGDVLRRHARTTDLAVRYGGDEFVVLLPQTTLAEASVFAERVRSEVARRAVCGLYPTVSIGVAFLSGPDSDETDADLLQRADAAAYTAKRQGGNRICTEDEVRLAGIKG
ncbi:MAG TPA: diguanylate cyclase [Polyangia bacterium]|nr:diguanylate cyclase [Polyangia bacterium]